MTDTLTKTTDTPSRPARPSLRGLVWVTWRQHRTALVGITAVFLLSAMGLLWFGLKMHSDFKNLGLVSCQLTPARSNCSSRLDAFSGDQAQVNHATNTFLLLPVLFGLFIGAPLLAREYESGTYRFTFTQGAGRTRWLATKIVLLGAFTIATALAFTLVVIWWYGPLVGLDGRLGNTAVYEVYGAVFVGRALFAFALGLFAGVLIRRVVAAIAMTLAGWFALVVVSITQLRSHLLTPVTTVNSAIPANSFVLHETWTAPGGHVLNAVEISDLRYNTAMAGHKPDLYQYVARQGYTYTASYQPGSRFWAFQSIEAGALAVLSLALIVAAVWFVRRRAA